MHCTARKYAIQFNALSQAELQSADENKWKKQEKLDNLVNSMNKSINIRSGTNFVIDKACKLDDLQNAVQYK